MIFSVGMYGEIHKNEARRWFNSLRRYAKAHPSPFYALVDLNKVSFIGTTARIQFAEATHLPQVKGLIFIATEPHMLQAVRMISMLGQSSTTHVFDSIDAARQFADTPFQSVCS